MGFVIFLTFRYFLDLSLYFEPFVIRLGSLYIAWGSKLGKNYDEVIMAKNLKKYEIGKTEKIFTKTYVCGTLKRDPYC